MARSSSAPDSRGGGQAVPGRRAQALQGEPEGCRAVVENHRRRDEAAGLAAPRFDAQ